MMKAFQKFFLAAAMVGSVSGCGDYLNTDPQDILTDDQVWGSQRLVVSVLSDFYSRLPLHIGLQEGQFEDIAAYDEAIWTGVPTAFQGEALNDQSPYPFGHLSAWGGHYDLLRDIHVAIDGITEAGLSEAFKTQYLAELRYMRAFTYFDLVKRMGGVPLVTAQLEYDFSGDPSSIQLPRATEAEIYDYIDSELTAIQNQLGNAGSETRATRGAALALQSRAMLYAGSLARHNSEMASPITLPGGEVGIPGSRAAEYYQKSLAASTALINGGSYSLYQGNADPGENFYEIFDTKGNGEVIFAKDYLASVGSNHLFTLNVIPRSMRVDIFNNRGAGALSPSLELVQNFDFLDGSSGELAGVGDATQADHNQANWIFYDNVEDIFANKDPRLYGTVIYPGTSFTGERVDLQAGVAVWNGSSYDVVTGARASTYDDGGVLTGEDGPTSAESYTSNTGFYVRKYLSRASYARTAATQADNQWIYFRLGEIYMNAAEAAFELGQEAEAVGYVNELRERAGFPANSLTSLSRDKIRSERWAELAFEDHRIFDLRRWRIGHEVLDGVSENSWVNVLFPYRVIRPGHPDDGKFVFSTRESARQTSPRRFQLGNYYSSIDQGIINNNPKIVRNPFH